MQYLYKICGIRVLCEVPFRISMQRESEEFLDIAPENNVREDIKMILETKNNNLLIHVKDYACGMPQKVKDKLFKEMITTKGKNGTGLGLYMSYSTIKAHFNGDITFESEEGKGTTFTIIIPI